AFARMLVSVSYSFCSCPLPAERCICYSSDAEGWDEGHFDGLVAGWLAGGGTLLDSSRRRNSSDRARMPAWSTGWVEAGFRSYVWLRISLIGMGDSSVKKSSGGQNQTGATRSNVVFSVSYPSMRSCTSYFPYQMKSRETGVRPIS